MTNDFNSFRNKTLAQIKFWSWCAAVLPIAGLAATFFVWAFGTNHMLSIVMIIGETVMFTVAVIWWWWAIYVINRILRQWDSTRVGISEVLKEVKAVKILAKETFTVQNDK